MSFRAIAKVTIPAHHKWLHFIWMPAPPCFGLAVVTFTWTSSSVDEITVTVPWTHSAIPFSTDINKEGVPPEKGLWQESCMSLSEQYSDDGFQSLMKETTAVGLGLEGFD